jgi:hypothetical protein
MKKGLILSLLLTLIFVVGCSQTSQTAKTPQPEPQKQETKPAVDKGTLTAVKTTSAPKIDGKADESFWANAPEMSIELSNAGVTQGGTGGKYNNGSTTVSTKAVYDAENLYMLLKWKDPTESSARGPWILEKGKLVSKPYNEYYEDKFAIAWNINDSVKGFNEQGCLITCHAATDKEGKTITKHWTNAPGELLDTWHWKMVRQNSLNGPDKPGLMHDQYWDDRKYDANNPDTSSAGRRTDPGPKEYEENKNADKTAPKLVHDGPPINGNPYVIVEGLDKTKPFTEDYLKGMKEGDFIPGAIAKQISGSDAADILVKGKYDNGMWTLEIQRKLKTTSDKDIQFTDLSKNYTFAMAGFDNSQIGHAYEMTTHKLVFKP